MIRTWLATLAVLVTALGFCGWATYGFSAYTAEGRQQRGRPRRIARPRC